MNLDSSFGNAEVRGDLLVRQPAGDQGEYLSLARRHVRPPAFESHALLVRGLQSAAALGRATDGWQQRLAVNRLLQKVHRAALHSLYASFDVAVASDKHQREIGHRSTNLLLELHPIEARHPPTRHPAITLLLNRSVKE